MKPLKLKYANCEFLKLNNIENLRFIKKFLENCMSGYSVHLARHMAGIGYKHHYYLLENYEEYRRIHDLFKQDHKGFYTGTQQKSRVVKRKI